MIKPRLVFLVTDSWHLILYRSPLVVSIKEGGLVLLVMNRLRDQAKGLTDEARRRDEGFPVPAPIRRIGKNTSLASVVGISALDDVLMFQAWLEAQGRNGGAPGVEQHGLAGMAG